jgi:hypothetical protein
MSMLPSEPGSGRLVRALQSDRSVVTYRAFVGVMATVIATLLAVIGADLRNGQAELQKSMAKMSVLLARNSTRLDDQEARLNRVDGGLAGLNSAEGALDRRVTFLEARQAAKAPN